MGAGLANAFEPIRQARPSLPNPILRPLPLPFPGVLLADGSDVERVQTRERRAVVVVVG